LVYQPNITLVTRDKKMNGLMQDWPLLISRFIQFSETNHTDVEIISVLPEGGMLRTNYGAVSQRSKKIAQTLSRLGIKPGDRVGTLAWNTHRHLEIWFGTSGMGAVTHTVNPRLFPEQLIYIINHAEDIVLFVDLTFISIVQDIASQLETVKHFVIMVGPEHMPAQSSVHFLCYEELLNGENGQYSWPEFNENTASSLCYTSGTTGDPKGVLYSHRSNYLHTMSAMGKDAFNIGSLDVVMPVVPMFHANAWGIPYGTAGLGAKLVLIGPHHDAETLHNLIVDEGVTISAAVPTIWSGLLTYLEKTGKGLGKIENIIIGGSSAPRSMIKTFKDKYGVWVSHVWGMTELSPLGTVCKPNSLNSNISGDELNNLQCMQGRGVMGIEMSIKSDTGDFLPWDGRTQGNLMSRGPWVLKQYFKSDTTALDDDMWFETGDVATINRSGYMQITDRSKDVIKSGGEWISSIDIENAALSHPAVQEAAVISHFHPKWEERPLIFAVLKEGKTLNLEDMNEHLKPLVAKWWLPNGLILIDKIPHTATGKISKKCLRKLVLDYQFPDFYYSEERILSVQD
jgi:acyl-CoA synthetase (AMP-forming)/AMP-acid ligase II